MDLSSATGNSNKFAIWVVEAVLITTLLFVASSVQAADNTSARLDAKTTTIIKRDFHDKGIAKVKHLNQNPMQALCTKYLDKPPSKDWKRLETQQEKAIKWPADGRYMGNWKSGEKMAQNGEGMMWSDKPKDPAGGNCYNCHQLTARENSYGNIGPSLLHYGNIRGNSRAMQRYTYGQIYNAKANNICSVMPRFGHMGILTEAQIKDLVALLLDPESPVNKD